jgi:hypothetical protein
MMILEESGMLGAKRNGFQGNGMRVRRGVRYDRVF